MNTTIGFAGINWLAVAASVVIGQVFLTLWFAVVFKEPWARAYGATDAKQHTSEVPGYTYAIGLACTFLLTVGLAMLLRLAGVSTLAGALTIGFWVALCFVFATALPGYAFLRRWSAFVLATGSQVCVTLIIAAILGLWPR